MHAFAELHWKNYERWLFKSVANPMEQLSDELIDTVEVNLGR